jgi:cell division protein FtsB
MVRRFAPLALMLSALFTVVLSLFGEDSYSRLEGLKKGVMLQQEENATLLEKVTELREEVAALRNSPRALEKAARNELGLARPQEQVFIFERRAEKKSVCPASKNCEASDAL